MADSGAQDRNLPASERKLRRAREDGQVPRSRDLGHFGAIAVGIALLAALAPGATGRMKALLAAGLRFDRRAIETPAAMGERLADFAAQFVWAVLPIGAVAVVVALATGVALGGWNFTLKALAPKFGKLNPVAGLPKLVSADRLIDTGRSCLLALVLGGVAANPSR